MAICRGPAGSSNRVPVASASQMLCLTFERFFSGALPASIQSCEKPPAGGAKKFRPLVQVAVDAPKPKFGGPPLPLAVNPAPKFGAVITAVRRANDQTPVVSEKVDDSPWLLNASQVQSVPGTEPCKPAVILNVSTSVSVSRGVGRSADRANGAFGSGRALSTFLTPCGSSAGLILVGSRFTPHPVTIGPGSCTVWVWTLL